MLNASGQIEQVKWKGELVLVELACGWVIIPALRSEKIGVNLPLGDEIREHNINPRHIVAILEDMK